MQLERAQAADGGGDSSVEHGECEEDETQVCECGVCGEGGEEDAGGCGRGGEVEFDGAQCGCVGEERGDGAREDGVGRGRKRDVERADAVREAVA